MADAYDFCYFGGFIFNEMSVFALSSVVNANFLSFFLLGFTAALAGFGVGTEIIRCSASK